MAFYLTLGCNNLEREHRLRGEWEVGVPQIIIGDRATVPNWVWIVCNLVEYSAYKKVSIQLLDIVKTKEKLFRNRPSYTKLLAKRFKSKNMQLKSDAELDIDYYLKYFYIRLYFRKQ